MKDVLARAVQEKAEPFPGKLGEGQIVVGLQLDLDDLLGIFQQFFRLPERGGGNLDRPEGDRVAGLKLAGIAGDRFGVEGGILLDPVSGRGDGLFLPVRISRPTGKGWG